MKKEDRYVIKNIETGHYYCENKYNFCTNIKYAKTFGLNEAIKKEKELKEFFNCEVEIINENSNNV